MSGEEDNNNNTGTWLISRDNEGGHRGSYSKDNSEDGGCVTGRKINHLFLLVFWGGGGGSD